MKRKKNKSKTQKKKTGLFKLSKAFNPFFSHLKRYKFSSIQNKKTGKVLIFAGILIFALGFFTKTSIYFKWQMERTEFPRVVISYQVPEHISIPSQNLEVNVHEGGIVNGNWILSDASALYLPTSGLLGEGYNTIIYAHNTYQLFGKLKAVKNGDTILVEDKLGKVYKYKVFQIEAVDPNNLAALYSPGKNILTLFTCSGWADTSRMLVKASLVNQPWFEK